MTNDTERPPAQPWYERPTAPLAPEERDGYDRAMRPGKMLRPTGIFPLPR